MELPLEIVRLQVQREPLKKGKAPLRVYDPGDLVPVVRLDVDPAGAHGTTADGERIIDVHHRDHPRTRDPKARGGLVFLTTGDYRSLRAKFGEHLADGIAGESILVEHEPGLHLRTLPETVQLQTADGTVELRDVRPADPCVEFSRFCLRRPPSAEVDQRLRELLVELDDGARGFRCVAAAPATIRLGDTLLIG